MAWWWLSFADPDKPRGSQHLGVSIVEGEDIYDASGVAWAYGCNPGGQILGYKLDAPPAPGLDHRMLTKDEMDTYGASTREDLH